MLIRAFPPLPSPFKYLIKLDLQVTVLPSLLQFLLCKSQLKSLFIFGSFAPWPVAVAMEIGGWPAQLQSTRCSAGFVQHKINA